MSVNTESIAHVDSSAKPTLVYLASVGEERRGMRREEVEEERWKRVEEVEDERRDRRREKRSKTREEIEDERRDRRRETRSKRRDEVEEQRRGGRGEKRWKRREEVEERPFRAVFGHRIKLGFSPGGRLHSRRDGPRTVVSLRSPLYLVA